MDQFGLHMNFLWIIPILALIFTLKIIFYLLFLGFSNSWTGRTNTRECRGLGAKGGPQVGSIKTEGPKCKSAPAKVYAATTTVRLKTKRQDSILHMMNWYVMHALGSRSCGLWVMGLPRFRCATLIWAAQSLSDDPEIAPTSAQRGSATKTSEAGLTPVCNSRPNEE
jgi:hypothetical protein